MKLLFNTCEGKFLLPKNNKAFTLIELLVVIAIIGILGTLAIIALQQARSRARDSKRVADMKQVQTSLDLFYNQHNRYPTADEWNSGVIGTTGEIFMTEIPKAPAVADGNCSEEENSYVYIPSDDNSSYQISFCIGKEVSNLVAGNLCLTPGGVENKSCIAPVCTDWTYSDWGDCMPGNEQTRTITSSSPENCEGGSPILTQSCVYIPPCSAYSGESSCEYNGYTYNIITIGSQIWFAQNLRVTKYKNGDSIYYPGSNNLNWQNATQGAYACYNNIVSNCTAYGAFYNRYAANDSRGLCPEGWSVPTTYQFEALRDYLISRNTYGCNDGSGYDNRQIAKALSSVSNWSSFSYACYPGNNSSSNNSSSFNIVPIGSRSPNDGDYDNFGSWGLFWTRGSQYSWGSSNNSKFISTSSTSAYNVGYPIRCIKN